MLHDVVQQRQHAHHVIRLATIVLLQLRHLRVNHRRAGGHGDRQVVEEAADGQAHELRQLLLRHGAEIGEHTGVAHGDRDLGVGASQQPPVENPRDHANHLLALLLQNHALIGRQEEGGHTLLELHVVTHHQKLLLVRLQLRRRRDAAQRREAAQDRHGRLLRLRVVLRQKVHQHVAQHGRAVAVLDRVLQVLEQLQERLEAA